MRFSEEKTNTINKQIWRRINAKRLFVHKDCISIGRYEDDSMVICNIEDLYELEEACKELRETIQAVADVWY